MVPYSSVLMVSRYETRQMGKTAISWLITLPICVLFIVPTSQTIFADDVYKSIENPEAKAFGNRVCTNKECVKFAAMLIQDGNDKVAQFFPIFTMLTFLF
uniref:Neur_chan_memb domain-containing protein n=1 Tax=Panagrellus redivivus TaxID=6233 RepID=A0A7E4ZTJ6_PANRE